MFFYYSNDPNRPSMPLSTKLLLGSIVILAFVLLFVFGFTFFLIALAGGVLTFLADLFGIRRRRNMETTTHPHPRDPRFGQWPPHSSSSSHSSRKYRDDDDVIDV
ncbi:exported hypothetical protein [Nitrospina gracilis 3/211]|uniref:Transmembrane protein n=1 Tax=Nitrospina gracilis (strain 3/211) TaxID=1266370 RepID=M1Z2E5_NITG3|nr:MULTISPECIES: hypothetical protein [Nitrospina]MCF8724493.1 hypothetical protein [Nitrospina sp. Nb-3]CCQ91656.1 exported hypothetical protein [Nitrospina gracilis 3/211]